MKETKTRVFLTGATGVMGMAGLKELTSRPDKYEVTVLARDSKKNRKKLQPFIGKGVRVVWGDLLDPLSIEKGVAEADIVLHVGGMVSPQADFYPEKTLKVNVGSMKLIADAVRNREISKKSKAKEGEDRSAGVKEIKVVYIGSVAQYGSRIPPNHWGSTADPMCPAKGDAYALSKVEAEKVLKDSGVKKWVSIRQTAILHPGLLKNFNNPVVFHTPLHGVLEWISTEDSGRLLERVCRSDVPDSFWGKCYNAGGGAPFRKVNIDFERAVMKAVGCPPPEKIFEPNWFATDNFHGMWFEDSDDLDAILHFRESDTFEDAVERLKATLPFYFRLAPLAPAFLIKAFMKKVASKPGLGPLWWIKTNDTKRIEAAWGSLEEYRKIKGWQD